MNGDAMKRSISFARGCVCLIGLTLAMSARSDPAQEPIQVLAAGSLKSAFTAIIAEWQRAHADQPVSLTTSPAGALRERIEHGETFDLYASAALTHAEALHQEGWTGPAVMFAHNRLCATVRAESGVTSQTLVTTLLSPATRIATSTPKSDPGGDYTWEFFRRIDQQHPGAFSDLTIRAKQVYGGPVAQKVPSRSLSAMVAEGEFDVAIGYCSGMGSLKEPAVKSVPLPAPAPMADYGLAVSRKAGAPVGEFAMFVLSPVGQRILADHGFISVGLPSD